MVPHLKSAPPPEEEIMTLKSILVSAALASTVATGVFADGLVGIAMPTKSSSRWISDGESMVKQFEDAGYQTILQYAEDDIPNQLAQIENMITNGVDVLVIAAIDGTTLSNALENANYAGVEVVAYDRLIRDSPHPGMSSFSAARPTTTTPTSSTMARCRCCNR
jgi:putative multiple sugar transport system substrate-binding protein